MRVLHIDTGKEMRGGQRQVLLLMKGLKKAGHENMLLARPGTPLWGEAAGLGFAVKPVGLTSVWRESQISTIVHAHDARAHTLAALASRRPFVVSRRVAFPIGRSVTSKWKYGRARRFLAVSDCVAQELTRAGVNGRKIDVVYDGVESCIDAEPWRAECPAVAPATDDPEKGSDLATAAAAMASIPLVFSHDLSRDLMRASMFLYITRSEGLGSAALLAMRMGVPVIASRVGGLQEVFVDDRSGLLVENDTDKIARAMCRVRDEPGLAQRLIAGGRARIAEAFTTEHLVTGTLQAYARALAH